MMACCNMHLLLILWNWFPYNYHALAQTTKTKQQYCYSPNTGGGGWLGWWNRIGWWNYAVGEPQETGWWRGGGLDTVLKKLEIHTNPLHLNLQICITSDYQTNAQISLICLADPDRGASCDLWCNLSARGDFYFLTTVLTFSYTYRSNSLSTTAGGAVT